MQVAELSQQRLKPGVQERAFQFAIRILRLVRALARDVSSQVIARQIARSGTSVGANVEEAQGGLQRAGLRLPRHEGAESGKFDRLGDRRWRHQLGQSVAWFWLRRSMVRK